MEFCEYFVFYYKMISFVFQIQFNYVPEPSLPKLTDDLPQPQLLEQLLVTDLIGAPLSLLQEFATGNQLILYYLINSRCTGRIYIPITDI